MVTLTNLKKVNNKVITDYYPEGEASEIGHIEYDITTSVAEVSLCKTDLDSHLKTYYHKAVDAIEKLVKKNEFPETYRYMWY